MAFKEYSPFSPGSPVSPEMFVGRIDLIKQVREFVRESRNGKQNNVFLTGDRGIGKSSFASYLRHIAVDKEKMLGIHTYLGGINSLEGMVKHIFDSILKETKNTSWFSKISSMFGNAIEEVDLFGVSLKFSPKEGDLKSLVNNFPEAILNLVEKIKENKAGLFIALDDINGLADKPEFANWYKSFVDHIGTHYSDFPVFIMLIGLPEKRESLFSFQESLMRIFRPVEIEKLDYEDVSGFFSDAFSDVGMEIDKAALEIIVPYSGGLPILMHEIGDAVFRSDEDGKITEIDAAAGVYNASQIIGKKYLTPKVYNVLQSERYRSILRKLGKELPKSFFYRAELEAKLTAAEKKVFGNFIKRIRDLGVIEPYKEKGRGAYSFVNKLYPVYIWIESEQFNKKIR